jgi:hypothetical protein
MTLKRLFISGGLVLVIGACGVSNLSPRAGRLGTHTRMSTSLGGLSARFQSAEDTVNRVAETVTAALMNVQSTNAYMVQATVAPLVTASETFRTTLQAIPWPPNISPNAHSVERAVSNLTERLVVVNPLIDVKTASWYGQFGAAATELNHSVNALRHDLGLPPTDQAF